VELDPSFDSTHHEVVDSRNIVNSEDFAKLSARTREGSGDDPTDLKRFTALDRKTILYQGFGDDFINPFNTIQFYEDWAHLQDGYSSLKQNARLFMLPGIYHCGGGPGPNTFDSLEALEQWVENGRSPETLIASKYRDDDVKQSAIRTMPICSFPKQAHYLGTGDINTSENWSCTENKDLLLVGPAGIQAGPTPIP
jgi:feruloyl esterase